MATVSRQAPRPVNWNNSRRASTFVLSNHTTPCSWRYGHARGQDIFVGNSTTNSSNATCTWASRLAFSSALPPRQRCSQ